MFHRIRRDALPALHLAAIVTVFASAPGCEESAPPAAAPPPVEVETAQLVAQDIPVTFEFVGRTASSQRVEIRARVNGFLDEIAYEEGAAIEKGDVLFRIDPAPFNARLQAAQAELAQQEARLENAQALLERIEPLAAAEAVSQKELDDARGRMREAAAAVEAATARVNESDLNLGYTTIKSPVTGLAGEASQREGAYITGASGALTYVARIDPIWVEFSVSETQALRSVRSQRDGVVVYPEEGAFDVEIILSDGIPHDQTGRITFSDATVDERTGTFLVRADIPNPEHDLRPGQYVRVLLHGARRPNAIAAPQRAIRQSPKGAFAWVVTEQGVAEQRPVTTGPWLGDRWIIESGLKDGERVVVGSSPGLQAGAEVTIVRISRTDDDASKTDGSEP
ncbi:MAG: efflux RND transporter periplasmic adaptor subunit [Phycisphaerales bacterium]